MRHALTALALLALAGAARAQIKNIEPVPRHAVETGAKYAIVVGIADYDEGRLRLSAAGKDAQQVADFLKRADRTGGYEVFLLVDKQATRRAIASALETVKERSGPNDTVLFFFSGHGMRDEDGDEAIRLYRLAAAQGNADAKKELQRLGASE